MGRASSSDDVIRDGALVDEAMKKSGLVWLRTATSPGGRAVWHAWVAGRAYVLTGGGEQPDPGLVPGEPATLVVRSKDTMARLVTFEADASVVTPADEDWVIATTELAKSRLNLRDAESAPQRWAADTSCVVYRLAPVTELSERPGDYLDSGGDRAAPVPTTATTTTPKPWVIHKRGGSGSKLS